MTDFLDSILERYRRYGWTEPAGEWGAIQAENRTELRLALESGNRNEVEYLLDEMFAGPMAYGLVSMGRDPANQLPQMVNWRLALWAKITAPPVLERLACPMVGSPMTISLPTADEGLVQVMVDTPRFDTYAQRLAKVLPKNAIVLEIGPGYGGFALQLRRARPDVQIILVDIPETLYLAGYWLSKAGQSVGWWDEGTACDIALVRASELTGLNGLRQCVDAVVAFHTLSGLGPTIIAQYMTWLGDSSAKYFYQDEVTETVTGIWMTDTFPETLASEMLPPASFKEVWRDRTPWTGLTDRFCEFFYERAA